MSEVQARARRQQRVEELCGAAIRALSAISDLHFRGARLHRGRRMLPRYAAHLHPSLDGDDFTSFRGAADGLALRLAHSDATTHARHLPEDSLERLVFALLEQFRCESLASAAMPGVRSNLQHRFEAWSLGVHDAGFTDTATGLLLYTVAQVCRARVTGEAVVEATEDLLEATRFDFAPLIGDALFGLRSERADQAAYAVHALRIARCVATLLRDARAATGQDEAADTSRDDPWARWDLLLDQGDEVEATEAHAASNHSLVLESGDGAYRVFTTAYDREVQAATLARPQELAQLRQRLDARISATGLNVAQLARELHVLLALPDHEGWDGGREQGQIDGHRLAQLVASPTERRIFREPREEHGADCLVSVLIDCSGSMKEHSAAVAEFVDVFVRALERAGVTSEVLGFTTFAWNGGRARRDWLCAGRPAHPGRLNEACHIVFKDAKTPWPRARASLAALLKADLFREGIDGEAVLWALRRMQARDESRKLLIVVSDGSPMDGATNLANDEHYLDHHLRDVIAEHERRDALVFSLGVGLDLSPYYSRSQVLDLSGSVGMPVFRELIGLIASAPRR